MALENPLPPRQLRENNVINTDLAAINRRSLRTSSDRMNSFELDDEGSFRSSSKIDMKQLVSAAKMSISPSGRDIVMASRDGLFIIDLDNPHNLPSFLPQGGMWEIADVQWNPHSSWSNYILSTSGEKLLVWNLGQSSKTHIEHILQSHIRAITDINWHNSTPSRLATCAIDSWVWLWDLRAGTNPTTKIKPTMGLSAFNESATQVKWNFRNEHILASSHNNQVLVWDERKGSKPINEINAHDSKIYGVNWSRFSDHEITTCSLDKTIKKWDASKETASNEPLSVIRTEYPVWRARSLPFGRGILAQPQRGRNALDMYRYDLLDAPVHTFEGFSEMVTEFVWRGRGGDDDNPTQREYELVTWDRASVLRLWPVDISIMEKVGYSPTASHSPVRKGILTERSYRDELELQSNLDPVITAPTHQSGVLKSIKASQSHGIHRSKADILGPSSTSPVNRFKQHSQSQAARIAAAATTATAASSMVAAAQDAKYTSTTMGKGHGTAARPTLDANAWRSAIADSHRRSSSNGSNSARVSKSLSRGESRVRARRSGSRARDGGYESEGPANLKEEIAQAKQKFEPKLSIVDVNLNPGSRKCSIEINGPTGLFVRILFAFRDDYPGGRPPIIDIDPNHKIKPTKRAFILRELRNISAHEPLVIEPCIRFLLGLPAQGQTPKPFSLDSDSDDENVQVDEFPGMDTAGAPKIQQNQPPRERTSQAVFSANGTLVRIVKTESNRPKQGISPVRKDARSSNKTTSHLGDLPLALRGLATMAKALPTVAYADPNAPESSYDFADSFSTQPGVKHTGILGPMWNRGMPFMHRARGKASVLIEHFPSPDPDEFDPELAAKFAYTSKNPVDFCVDNALMAALHGRGDYRRILESLAIILRNKNIHDHLWNDEEPDEKSIKLQPIIKGLHKIYDNLVRRRNLQMLAMFSMALLLADSMHRKAQPEKQDIQSLAGSSREDLSTQQGIGLDYFSLRPLSERPRQMIPTPPETASPEEVETPPAASTPPPQRSLTAKAGGAFGGVLYPFFFPGTSDGNEQPRKNRGSDPPTPVSNDVPGSIPVPQRGSFFRSNARSPRQHRGKSDASVPTLGSIPGPSTSSGTGSFGRLNLPGKSKKPGSTFVPTPGTINKITVTFALRGKPKARLTSSIPQDRWRREDHKMPVPSIKFHKKTDLYSSGKRFTMPEALRVQYITHIHVYAELLFRIGLVAARAEVLDITGCPPLESELNSLERDHLIIRSVCRDCGELHDDLREMRDICPTHFIRRPECTFCRLPVRGLSRTCLKCKHTTHLKCWDQHQRSSDQTKSITCASGCGCECPTNASFNALGAPVQPTQKPASPVAFRQWAL